MLLEIERTKVLYSLVKDSGLSNPNCFNPTHFQRTRKPQTPPLFCSLLNNRPNKFS